VFVVVVVVVVVVVYFVMDSVRKLLDTHPYVSNVLKLWSVTSHFTVWNEKNMWLLIFCADAEQNPMWIESLNENFESLISRTLHIEKNTDRSKNIANKIKKFYFGDERICEKTRRQYADVSKLGSDL
jgi:hypothetical protein